MRASEFPSWLEANRHRLSGRGVWTLGREANTFSPEGFEAARCRLLVTRLSSYRDTAASITHPLLLSIARRVPGAFVDFCYLPPPRDYHRLRDAGMPRWFGTGTARVPRDFDVVGISNALGVEVWNIPHLLRDSGIPLSRRARLEDPGCPLVVLGGMNAAAASGLLSGPAERAPAGLGDGAEVTGEDALVDGIVIGEAERALPRLLELVAEGRREGIPRGELLRRARTEVPGFYDPAGYRHVYRLDSRGRLALREIRPEAGAPFPVERTVARDLDRETVLEAPPVFFTEDAGTMSVEISRGCPNFCSFCAEGYATRPYRERSAASLAEEARALKRDGGLTELNLMSYNFNTHAELYPLLMDTAGLFGRTALKSQRFDLLAGDPELGRFERRIGKSQFTCGMEGISERLRRYLHKNLTEDQILTSTAGLFREKARELKVFLIATGREEESDLVEFDGFVERLMSARSAAGAGTRVIFSLTPLFSPPLTPLQFAAFRPAPKAVIHRIRGSAERRGAELRLAAEPEEIELCQLLGRADRRATAALVRAALAGDLRYQGEEAPPELLHAFRAALLEDGIDLSALLEARDLSDLFPWDDLDLGVPRGFLWEEYSRSMEFEEEEYCLGRPWQKPKCLECGACTTPAEYKVLLGHKTSKPPPADALDRLEARIRKVRRTPVLVRVPDRLRHVPREVVSALAAREMMRRDPGLVERYRGESGRLRRAVDRDGAAGLDVLLLDFERVPEGSSDPLDGGLPSGREPDRAAGEAPPAAAGSLRRTDPGEGVEVLGVLPGESLPEPGGALVSVSVPWLAPAEVRVALGRRLKSEGVKNLERRVGEVVVVNLKASFARKTGFLAAAIGPGPQGGDRGSSVRLVVPGLGATETCLDWLVGGDDSGRAVARVEAYLESAKHPTCSRCGSPRPGGALLGTWSGVCFLCLG